MLVTLFQNVQLLLFSALSATNPQARFFLGGSCSAQTMGYLRFHVEQVTHGDIGVAFAIAKALREQFVLGPRHVNPVGPGLGLVIYRGVRCRVSVVDELGLERRERGG